MVLHVYERRGKSLKFKTSMVFKSEKRFGDMHDMIVDGYICNLVLIRLVVYVKMLFTDNGRMPVPWQKLCCVHYNTTMYQCMECI